VLTERLFYEAVAMRQHTSEILFHCWKDSDIAQARDILIKILDNGLLMTINRDLLDQFSFNSTAGRVSIEVMQEARVCFTDIPIDLLHAHGTAYGKYGVGFSRETIVNWGGCPAWYLPNHFSDAGLKSAGSSLVHELHAAMAALEGYEGLIQTFEAFKAQGVAVPDIKIGNSVNADQLSGIPLINWIRRGELAVSRCLSFIKEMSHVLPRVFNICTNGNGESFTVYC
jgi:hypothetical protein